MEKLDKISIVAVLPVMLALLDLLIGNDLLIQIGLVSNSNKPVACLVLISIAFIILAAPLGIHIFKFFRDGDRNSVASVFIILIVCFTLIGFVWDIVTSIYGFYSLLTSETSAVSSRIAACFLAIIMTSVSFTITLLLPNFGLRVPVGFSGESIENISDQLIHARLSRLIYFVLFGLAITFDFSTSFAGNASLLGFKDLQGIPVLTLLLLATGTFFVCLCQYIFWAYFTINKSE